MTATLQREHLNNQPTYLGDLFRVSKTRGDKTLAAVCRLRTHSSITIYRAPDANKWARQQREARRLELMSATSQR